jgi:membrane protein involved in colicin uptake
MKQADNNLAIDVAQPDAPVTTLAPAPRAVLALKSPTTEVEIAKLVEKHAGLVEVKNKAGRDQVHGAAMELMRYRTSIKARADEVREDAKKFNGAVIAEEKRLTALIEPEEQRLKALRDAWDTEQERIKREAEEKERQRVLALGARIQEVRGFARLAQDCRSSDAVRRLVDRMAGLDMTGFEEFEAEASNVYAETRQQVENVLNARLFGEAEVARLKAEREELARQQAEQKEAADKLAAERAEFERQQAEFAAQRAAAAQAELDKIAADVCITSLTGGETPAFTKSPDFGVAAIDTAVCPDIGTPTALPAIQPAMLDADLVDTAPAFYDQPAGGQPSAPSASELISAISDAFNVDTETAVQWLIARADDFEAFATDTETTTA